MYYRQQLYQTSLRFDEGSVLSVDLVIETTRIAQILSSAVSSPQRS